jgi:hypothetical protein
MLEKIATVVMVVCLVIAAINFGTALADPAGRLLSGADRYQPETITIINIYAPGDLYPGSAWIMDYLRDGVAQAPIYTPSSEHMDRLIKLWESDGITVKWLGAAE